jgi:hypothetical protein
MEMGLERMSKREGHGGLQPECSYFVLKQVEQVHSTLNTAWEVLQQRGPLRNFQLQWVVILQTGSESFA